MMLVCAEIFYDVFEWEYQGYPLNVCHIRANQRNI